MNFLTREAPAMHALSTERGPHRPAPCQLTGKESQM